MSTWRSGKKTLFEVQLMDGVEIPNARLGDAHILLVASCRPMCKILAHTRNGRGAEWAPERDPRVGAPPTCPAAFPPRVDYALLLLLCIFSIEMCASFIKLER